MTRIIKFRAWDKLSKRFVGVNWGYDIDNNGTLYEAKTRPETDLVLIQFTGLLDKNGKEIFEGDLFGLFGGDKDRPSQYEVHARVYFDKDLLAFCVDLQNGGWEYLSDYFNQPKTCKEIIGNIWESPELLK